ncbi:heavy-metal-associated domain-containing protein [Flaviaesturariibacter amylovorans]|uniref:HMA domain-containing protein n=1 Tax=Flaviaesturariibacter amylovorans TaxID=1084520 RepID=A0ABP8GLX8_9BACT
MRTLILVIAFLCGGVAAQAQFSRASLQASGLTCSMCSKAVKEALEQVPFVEKVQVDIKNQKYNLSFRPDSTVDFDALVHAVDDAGFSVAALQVTAELPYGAAPAKDEHLKIGTQYFHFLNAPGTAPAGPVTFSIVDKGFVPAKEHKKWSAASKAACVKTGRAAACCLRSGADARVFHVII